MKLKDAFSDAKWVDLYFHRMKGIFWISSIGVSLFTFFAPFLIVSLEHYSMVDEIVVKGYELVSYSPILAVFIITAPAINAMVHTSELPHKKRVIMYYAVGVVYVVAYIACILSASFEIIDVENCLVEFSGGIYAVLTANFMSLSLGAIPIMLMLEEHEEE